MHSYRIALVYGSAYEDACGDSPVATHGIVPTRAQCLLHARTGMALARVLQQCIPHPKLFAFKCD